MLATARHMMVEKYLRNRIEDERVLSVIGELPRHLFVEDALQGRAYSNDALPIGFGQTISQPFIVALMTQELELSGQETVLEIGTGSGYQAAVLSHLAREVHSVERIPQLAQRAAKVLQSMHIDNVCVHIADGTAISGDQHPLPAKFDRIIVTAGGNRQPSSLLRQLHIGGILLIPIGDSQQQSLFKYRRISEERWERQNLHQCSFVKLVGKEGWSPGEDAP